MLGMIRFVKSSVSPPKKVGVRVTKNQRCKLKKGRSKKEKWLEEL
jgi:hypothetical protein